MQSSSPADAQARLTAFLNGGAPWEIWPSEINARRSIPPRHRGLRMLWHMARLAKAVIAPSLLVHAPRVTADALRAVARGKLGDLRGIYDSIALATEKNYVQKIVSRRFKFIWISMPKVASRSFIVALLRVDPTAEFYANAHVEDIYNVHPGAADYLVFGFVRHPYARAMSLYENLHAPIGHGPPRYKYHLKSRRRAYFQRHYGLAATRSGFDDFCEWLNTPYASDARADTDIRSMANLLRLEDGRRAEFIGRIENLDADLRRLSELLGMPKPCLPTLHTKDGWERKDSKPRSGRGRSGLHAPTFGTRISEQSKRNLIRRYANDFPLGNYQP